MSEIRLNIDGLVITGVQGDTILDAARRGGIEIPTLCHDESVDVYGSCGICAVEAEGSPKLLRACSTLAADGMVIKTNTPRVRASRAAALDLMLSDHTGDCKAPCTLACPGDTDCQGYVGLIANGEHKKALELIKGMIPLPASIGRVCPHPCETECRRRLVEEPISILALKRFAADLDLFSENAYMPELKAPSGKKVAIIGGGPGGLSCAYYLLTEGHSPVIYDTQPLLGGMLRYGIPEYRLPKSVLDAEIRLIEKMGAEFKTNVKIGRDVTLEQLRNSYDAVYVSIGAWESAALGCPGEDLHGVLGGIHFLRAAAMGEAVQIGERVAVVGGGNTAMDACRTAVRLGAKEVTVLYRRTRAEMPAEDIEITEAEEEGVIFKYLSAPIEIIGAEGRVTSIKLQKMRLGEPDGRGRRSPVSIDGDIELMEIDTVIAAIGQSVALDGLEALEATKRGTIAADEHTFTTSLPGVFAGGDAVNSGPGIAITATGHARKAAGAICEYLSGAMPSYKIPYFVKDNDITEKDFSDRERIARAKLSHTAPEHRRNSFEEVTAVMDMETARREASRCLECGCHDVYECKLLKYANEYDVNPQKYDGEAHKRADDDGHPFIVRNIDKCILCGLCVRICDEAVGAGALGLARRGFDTSVTPAFGLPLKDTDCISCGRCVSACPTGALGERLKVLKPVPVKEESVKSACSFCSVGCGLELRAHGGMLLRSLPDAEEKDGLCARGRFGMVEQALYGERVNIPLIRDNGTLRETDTDAALSFAAGRLQGLIAAHGPEAVAVSISDRYTNEEISAALEFSRGILGVPDENIVCFNSAPSGIKRVFGRDASTNMISELDLAEAILYVGRDAMKEHSPLGMRLRRAALRGAKLITVTENGSMLDSVAELPVAGEREVTLLKGVLKALIASGHTAGASNTTGFEELEKSLADVTPSPEAMKLADIYGGAESAMIVYEDYAISPDAAALLAMTAAVTGHVGAPRNGVIRLKSGANGQGLADLGVRAGADILSGISDGSIRGLVIFGEDPDYAELDRLEFLCVQDSHMTRTAHRAHIVLPGAAPAEADGTFTSADRRIRRVGKAVEPRHGVNTRDMLGLLAEMLGKRPNPGAAAIPKASNADTESVLYQDGFAHDGKKACLNSVSDGPLFVCAKDLSYIKAAFEEFLEAL